MRGHVLWFRPGIGRGVVRNDTGQEWPIELGDDRLGLRGGDVVEFEGERAASGEFLRRDVRLIERGSSRLAREQSELLKEFLDSIRPRQ
jgi:hypothetical protein